MNNIIIAENINKVKEINLCIGVESNVDCKKVLFLI